MVLPPFNADGDLPPGIYLATLAEVLKHFGQGLVQRRAVSDRLNRLYQLATSTGQVARFIVFGSFVTTKDEPNDVDIILLMQDSFDLATVTGRPPWCFSTLKQIRTLEPVFSGYAVPGRLEVRKQW